MKLINPILISLNNTLHIKADNLEPVEVDSSCKSQLLTLAFNVGKHGINTFYELKEGEGINISELSDRIEVKEVHSTNKQGIVIKAFLLPEKEDKKEWIDKMMSRSVCSLPKKSYTIEEIEKAIDETMPHKYSMAWDNERFKKLFFNNLKK